MNRTKLPITKTGEEGTPKRNIIRKGKKGKRVGNGMGGMGGGRKANTKGAVIDDGSTYEDDPIAFSDSDPNYDEIEAEGYYLHSTVYTFNDNRTDVGNVSMTLSEYKKAVEKLVFEYFSSGDVDTVLESVKELEATEYSYELVKRAINMSLDKTDRERERVSRLLSAAYPDYLSSNMIGKGFERLFELVDEIEIDCPNASESIATFLARAVVDEIIPPSFLSDAVVCNLGGNVVDQAKRMLSRDKAGSALERIWGPGDGRPVEDLKVAVDELLKEYLNSSDIQEAIRCVKELNAHFWHHEIVKRAITIAIDRPLEQRSRMNDLISFMVDDEVISHHQCSKGFQRVYGILSDLRLDTPNAPVLLDEMTKAALDSGSLPLECESFLSNKGAKKEKKKDEETEDFGSSSDNNKTSTGSTE